MAVTTFGNGCWGWTDNYKDYDFKDADGNVVATKRLRQIKCIKDFSFTNIVKEDGMGVVASPFFIFQEGVVEHAAISFYNYIKKHVNLDSKAVIIVADTISDIPGMLYPTITIKVLKGYLGGWIAAEGENMLPTTFNQPYHFFLDVDSHLYYNIEDTSGAQTFVLPRGFLIGSDVFVSSEAIETKILSSYIANSTKEGGVLSSTTNIIHSRLEVELKGETLSYILEKSKGSYWLPLHVPYTFNISFSFLKTDATIILDSKTSAHDNCYLLGKDRSYMSLTHVSFFTLSDGGPEENRSNIRGINLSTSLNRVPVVKKPIKFSGVNCEIPSLLHSKREVHLPHFTGGPITKDTTVIRAPTAPTNTDSPFTSVVGSKSKGFCVFTIPKDCNIPITIGSNISPAPAIKLEKAEEIEEMLKNPKVEVVSNYKADVMSRSYFDSVFYSAVKKAAPYFSHFNSNGKVIVIAKKLSDTKVEILGVSSSKFNGSSSFLYGFSLGLCTSKSFSISPDQCAIFPATSVSIRDQWSLQMSYPSYVYLQPIVCLYLGGNSYRVTPATSSMFISPWFGGEKTAARELPYCYNTKGAPISVVICGTSFHYASRIGNSVFARYKNLPQSVAYTPTSLDDTSYDNTTEKSLWWEEAYIQITKTSKIVQHPGNGVETTVFQILALKTFSLPNGEVITAGSLGGWVSSEVFIREIDPCWVDKNSYIFGCVRIAGSCHIKDSTIWTTPNSTNPIGGQIIIAGNVELYKCKISLPNPASNSRISISYNTKLISSNISAAKTCFLNISFEETSKAQVNLSIGDSIAKKFNVFIATSIFDSAINIKKERSRRIADLLGIKYKIYSYNNTYFINPKLENYVSKIQAGAGNLYIEQMPVDIYNTEDKEKLGKFFGTSLDNEGFVIEKRNLEQIQSLFIKTFLGPLTSNSEYLFTEEEVERKKTEMSKIFVGKEFYIEKPKFEYDVYNLYVEWDFEKDSGVKLDWSYYTQTGVATKKISWPNDLINDQTFELGELRVITIPQEGYELPLEVLVDEGGERYISYEDNTESVIGNLKGEKTVAYNNLRTSDIVWDETKTLKWWKKNKEALLKGESVELLIKTSETLCQVCEASMVKGAVGYMFDCAVFYNGNGGFSLTKDNANVIKGDKPEWGRWSYEAINNHTYEGPCNIFRFDTKKIYETQIKPSIPQNAVDIEFYGKDNQPGQPLSTPLYATYKLPSPTQPIEEVMDGNPNIAFKPIKYTEKTTVVYEGGMAQAIYSMVNVAAPTGLLKPLGFLSIRESSWDLNPISPTINITDITEWSVNELYTKLFKIGSVMFHDKAVQQINVNEESEIWS